MEGYSVIGRLGSPHGTDGHIKAFLDIDWDNMEKGFVPFEAFFIEDDNGLPLPFFIESLEVQPGNVVFKLEEADSKEAAFEIADKLMYLPKEMVDEEPPEESRFGHLLGYTLIDEKEGVLGEIEDVFQLPMQEVAQLTFQGEELLIPLNEAFIISEDGQKKELRMDLPEGLTNLDQHED